MCDDFEPCQETGVCSNCGLSEQEHYPGITPINCLNCFCNIPLSRLYFFPGTAYCVKCVDKCGPKKVLDPDKLCAKASLGGGNGFSQKD